MSNLELWQSLEKTDPRYTTKYKKTGGFEGTAVKANHVAEFLTEKFGPVGFGWGFEEICHEITNVPQGEGKPDCPVFSVLVKVWLLHNNERIESQGRAGWPMLERRGQAEKTYYVVDSDAPTKALTHAWKKGFSTFGVMADVFMGLMDDPDYKAGRLAEIEKEERAEGQDFSAKQLDSMLVNAVGCKTPEDKISMVRYALPDYQGNGDYETVPGLPNRAMTALRLINKTKKIPFPDMLPIARGEQ